MLEAMRKHAQGWVAGLIVAVLTLAFALWGLEYYIGSRAGGEVVATVNGSDITTHDVARIYNIKRQQLLAQLGGSFNMDQNFQQRLKRSALQQLLDMRMLETSAREAGFSVSNEQVAAQIRQDPTFMVNDQFSPERFSRIMQVFGFSQEQYFDQYRLGMIGNQISAGIQGTSIALPSEIKNAVVLNDQERSFDFFEIPMEAFVPKVKITDKDLQKYYDQNKNEFQDPAKVRVEYIELKAENIEKGIQVSDVVLKNYYQDNKKLFTDPKQWHVSVWSIDLPAGAKHEQIVSAQNQLKALTEGKEDHGLHKATKKTQWITASKTTADLVKRLSELKPGQFTEVFATDNGVEVVKFLEEKPSKLKPYADVVKNVREQYIRHEVEREFAQDSDKLSEAVYTTPDSLASAADELGLKIQTSEYFSREGGASEFTKKPEFLKEAFSREVYESGNNSNVIEIEPGHVLVLRIKDKIPAKPKPFASVKTEIEKALRQRAAARQVKNLGERLAKSIKAGKSVDKELNQNKITWEKQASATRQQSGIKADILRVAFSIPDPEKTEHPVKGIALPNGDFVVVKLNKVITPSKVDLASNSHKIFAQAIEQGFGALEFDLYMKSLRDSADVTIKPNLGY